MYLNSKEKKTINIYVRKIKQHPQRRTYDIVCFCIKL